MLLYCCRSSGNGLSHPSSIWLSNFSVVGLLNVAHCTLSQVMDLKPSNFERAEIAEIRTLSSTSEQLSLYSAMVGKRDVASVSLLVLPGTCFIVNLYRSVFSFSESSLGLSMSSSFLLPSNFTSGL